MNAFVESPLWLLITALCFSLLACDKPPAKPFQKTGTLFEIMGISTLPDPDRQPYPSVYGGILVKEIGQTEVICIAMPAIKDRVKLEFYAALEVGQQIRLTPIPWSERPSSLNASYLANDIADDPDLKIFFDSL